MPIQEGLQNKAQDEINKLGQQKETKQKKVIIPITWLFDYKGHIRWSFLAKLAGVYATVTILLFYLSVFAGMEHDFNIQTTITTEQGISVEESKFNGSLLAFFWEIKKVNFKEMASVFESSIRYIPIALEDSISFQFGTPINFYYSAQRVLIDFQVYIPNLPTINQEVREEMEGASFFWMMDIFKTLFILFIILSFYQKYCQKKLVIANLNKRYYIPKMFLYHFYKRKENFYFYTKLQGDADNTPPRPNQISFMTRAIFGIDNEVYKEVKDRNHGDIETQERDWYNLYDYELQYVLGYVNSPSISDISSAHTTDMSNLHQSLKDMVMNNQASDLANLEEYVEQLEDEAEESESENHTIISENDELREDLQKYTKF